MSGIPASYSMLPDFVKDALAGKLLETHRLALRSLDLLAALRSSVDEIKWHGARKLIASEGSRRRFLAATIELHECQHYPASNFFGAKSYGGTGAHFLSWLRTAISQPLLRCVDKIGVSLKTACSAAKRAGTIGLAWTARSETTSIALRGSVQLVSIPLAAVPRFRSASSFLGSERYRNLYVSLSWGRSMSDDWFRRHTWTDSDRAEFYARLERSRTAFHKAQYARIQAYELHQAGGARYAREALDLLDTIVESWMGDAQRASVHHQRAECLRDLGPTLNVRRITTIGIGPGCPGPRPQHHGAGPHGAVQAVTVASCFVMSQSTRIDCNSL